jgi:hypothetical protein
VFVSRLYQLRLEGVLLIAVGWEMTVRSPAIGHWHWRRAGFTSEARYQGAWLAVGVGVIVFGAIALVLG